MREVRPLILLTLFLCWAQPGLAADTSAPGANQSRLEAPDAEQGTKAPDFASALKSQMHETVRGPDVEPPAADDSIPPITLKLLGLCALLSFYLLLRFVRYLHQPATPPKPVSGIDVFSNLLAEDEGFLELMRAMKEGPAVTAVALPDESGGEPPAPKGPLEEFFEKAPDRIAMARKIFSEIGRVPDAAARQAILGKVSQEADWLKSSSNHPELLPAWQMAAALEGLLKQLTRNASNLTPSALRTTAGALDLLQDLCVPGVKPNLTKKPPVRLLAVDDDAISRNAVSLALRKFFPEPALAADGEAALALAAQHSYDAIFLDVEMPGMDGFELCSKIHGTVPNQSTPVVFVTRHSDFEARAKSTLSGGEDLIGKPFLAFEITVKALTLVLRVRLGNERGSVAPRPVSRQTANGGAGLPSASKAAAILPVSPSPVPASTQPALDQESGRPRPQHAPMSFSTRSASEHRTTESKPANGTAKPSLAPDTRHPTPAPSPVPLAPRPSPLVPPSAEPSPAEVAKAFFTHAPAHLEEIRNQLQVARQAANPADLQEFMGELYVGIHSLSSETERAELRAISRLASSLEGMLKKLLEQPKLCNPSILDTAAAAIELLENLCRAGCNPDLANPPIRILVVDDDPVALRVIGGSLQLVFGRPDSAGSGEAALTLAAEKAFDLIFLDVLMPGIDGFTACSKIHETAPNRLTPVVFVTSHSDQESRSQAAASGGGGFIPKPVLASQITLTALTFILGSRLGKLKPACVAEPVEEVVC